MLLFRGRLASIQFFLRHGRRMIRFAHASHRKAKPSELALQLKAALADTRGIRAE